MDARDLQPLTLTDLGRALRARWRVLVAGVLLGLVGATAAVLVVPVTYTARTVVQVEADDPARVDMTAEQAVAASRRVTAEALQTLGDDTLTVVELESGLRAEPVGDSRVLRLTYRAPTALEAARGADAAAQAYLAVRAVDAPADPADAVTGEVVDRARVPRGPDGPGRVAWLVGGAMLGLVAATPLAAAPTRTRAARAS